MQVTEMRDDCTVAFLPWPFGCHGTMRQKSDSTQELWHRRSTLAPQSAQKDRDRRWKETGRQSEGGLLGVWHRGLD